MLAEAAAAAHLIIRVILIVRNCGIIIGCSRVGTAFTADNGQIGVKISHQVQLRSGSRDDHQFFFSSMLLCLQLQFSYRRKHYLLVVGGLERRKRRILVNCA